MNTHDTNMKFLTEFSLAGKTIDCFCSGNGVMYGPGLYFGYHIHERWYMINKAQDSQQRVLRSEVRSAALESASIAFKPPEAEMEYHFKLRDFSASGLGLLVKKDSRLLKYIHLGDIFPAKYYKENAATPPEHLKVQIQHISVPAGGKPENHVIVGLHFLEKMQ